MAGAADAREAGGIAVGWFCGGKRGVGQLGTTAKDQVLQQQQVAPWAHGLLNEEPLGHSIFIRGSQ
jgi:hypothetical protein